MCAANGRIVGEEYSWLSIFGKKMHKTTTGAANIVPITDTLIVIRSSYMDILFSCCCAIPLPTGMSRSADAWNGLQLLHLT